MSSAQLQEDYCPLLAHLGKKLAIQLNMAIYWTNHEPAAIVDRVVPSWKEQVSIQKGKKNHLIPFPNHAKHKSACAHSRL